MAGQQPDAPGGSPLLATKFYPPAWRPGLVARPHLVERIVSGVEGRLTLVSAPAGSGKTTLLGEWLAAREGGQVAWLSLDGGDSHPGRFWDYVLGALQRVRPGLGLAALAMLRSAQPSPIEAILTTVINDVAADAGNVVLVLDDYHVIESAPIHAGVSFLVDHMPAQLHLVIAGRADPPLPLARLRSRGELTEVRAADLRFSSDEAAAFLNTVMRLGLRAEDVAALERRTEGWIAGLQLAALSMQGRDDPGDFITAFAGDDRYIVDYLVEEVLQRQPPRVRDFLLRTSIVDRLCGPLCDAVTGEADGTAMLEALDRANLFVVPLDDRRRWYRYHHLFADVLRAHLGSSVGAEVGRLHRRASDWFVEARQTPEAVDHALLSGHLERAATLIESVAADTVRGYRPLQLLDWLRRLPSEVIEEHPLLCVYYAFALFPAGEMDAATRWLDVASRLVEDSPTATSGEDSADGLDSLPGLISLARGYHAMATGDVPSTVDHSRRALALLPDHERTWRSGAALLLALAPWREGDLETAAKAHAQGIAGLEQAGDLALVISAMYDAGRLAALRARLHEARNQHEAALRVWEQADDDRMPGAADAHLGLSALAVERRDLAAAQQHLHAAEELAMLALLPETPARLAVGRALLHAASGGLDAALDDLEEAERLEVPATVPGVPIRSMRARIALRAGRTAEVAAWVEQQGLSAGGTALYAREHEHLTLARLLIHRTRAGEGPGAARAALELLRTLLDSAHGVRAGSVIEILWLMALARQALGEVDAASQRLAEALTLAEPQGYADLFVSEGEPARDLLQRAIARGDSTAYATRLLDALGDVLSAQPGAGVDALPEPLTPREVEILRLIAAGMRNQGIADHLVISVATVKRHIANVYGKLGVDHRTEAVARANELRLI